VVRSDQVNQLQTIFGFYSLTWKLRIISSETIDFWSVLYQPYWSITCCLLLMISTQPPCVNKSKLLPPV